MIAALQGYVEDHLWDWDQNIDSLADSYTCTPHMSTSIAPFSLVLFKTTVPLTIYPNQTDQEQPGNLNIKSKFWFEQTIRDTLKRLKAA